MTEPLDFTSAGRQRAGQQTQPPPRPALKKQKRQKNLDPWWKSTKALVALAVIVVVVIGFLVVRSRGGDSAKAAAQKQADSCQVSRQFDLVASTTGAASASGTFDGPPPAMAKFVSESKSIVSKMKSLAPATVQSDLDIVVAAASKAAQGDRSALDSPAFTTAHNGLLTYQGGACPSGGDSGDG
jgi:hypothetical protein